MKDEFESALEAPAKTQTVDVEEPKRLPRLDLDMPPPTNVLEDGESADDWQPFAPKVGEAPLAKGETQETAIQPGDWHSPKVEERIVDDNVAADMELEEPEEDPLEASEEEDAAALKGLPEDARERLEQAVDAIEWLARRVKHLPHRTKEILRLRRNRLKELVDCLK